MVPRMLQVGGRGPEHCWQAGPLPSPELGVGILEEAVWTL